MPARNRTPSLDPIATQALITALAGPVGEYAARAEYAAVLAEFGAGVQPFANLLEAENRHIAALQRLALAALENSACSRRRRV